MEEPNLSTPELENQNNEPLSMPQEEEKKVFGEKQKKAFWSFFHKTKRQIRNAELKQKFAASENGLGNRNYNKYKKYFYPALGVVIVLVLAIFIGKSMFANSTKNQPASTQPQVSDALAKEDLNITFNFPFKNDKGKELGKVRYTLDSADLRTQIYIKGTPANALKGKQFIIVYLKLKNDSRTGVKINTRDYIRLSVNNNKDEWLGPNIHNDPVEVQAQSTEKTRVGFIINSTDKALTLRIGEIDGKKEIIELKLK